MGQALTLFLGKVQGGVTYIRSGRDSHILAVSGLLLGTKSRCSSSSSSLYELAKFHSFAGIYFLYKPVSQIVIMMIFERSSVARAVLQTA